MSFDPCLNFVHFPLARQQQIQSLFNLGPDVGMENELSKCQLTNMKFLIAFLSHNCIVLVLRQMWPSCLSAQHRPSNMMKEKCYGLPCNQSGQLSSYLKPIKHASFLPTRFSFIHGIQLHLPKILKDG